jgi:Winged helix DNA-binding domain
MAAASGAGDRLDRRALNRATLARQLLLDRVELPVTETVRRLGGLNAQDVEPPYLTLWARLAGFERDTLSRAPEDRAVVRGVLLRGTQHLVTAADHLAWRPLLQPVMDRFGRGALGRAGVDREALAAAARRHLDGRRLTRRELARLLAQDWPGHPPGELACRSSTCCRWSTRRPAASGGAAGRSRLVLAEAWLGRPLAAGSPEGMILRHLTAFGPASVADIQAWSGLTRLREPVERLGPALRPFRDEGGRQRSPPCGSRSGDGDRAVVEVEPLGRLAGPDRDAVANEGLRLLRFAATDAAATTSGWVGERRRPPSARQGRRQFSRQSEPTGAISAS